MKIRRKRRGERFSITISSQNDALRAPTSVVVRKSTMILIAVLILCVFGMSVYLSASVILRGRREKYSDGQPGLRIAQPGTVEDSVLQSGQLE